MCDMYKTSLRHIHDLVLSSLKMEGICLLFYFLIAKNTVSHDVASSCGKNCSQILGDKLPPPSSD
jgi:type III secretory pathway component EscU